MTTNSAYILGSPFGWKTLRYILRRWVLLQYTLHPVEEAGVCFVARSRRRTMTESTDAEAALYADGQCGEFRTNGSPASRVPPKTASRARPCMRNEEVAVGLADVQDFFFIDS